MIMNDYRNLSVGYPSHDTDTKTTAALSLRYRNPVSSVFANIGLGYEQNNRSLIESQLFASDLILTAYSPQPNSSDIYRLNGGVSKGILSGKVRFGIDMGYTGESSATVRNAVTVPCRLNAVSVTPRTKGTLARWLSVEYMLLAAHNAMNFTDTRLAASYRSLKQKLNVSLFPVKKIQAGIGAEHYRTKFDDNTADNLLLLDAGIRWVVSDIADIYLSASNLMNDGYYRYSRYETLSETVYRYRIRPRNVMVSVQVKI
jgi:hypothetical protein